MRAPHFALLSLAMAALGASLVHQASALQTCPAVRTADGARLVVERRADHALIADATVELATAAPIYLEYGSARTGWLRTPTSTAAASHHLPLLRLQADTDYQVRAFSLDAAGCPVALASSEVRSGELPTPLRNFAVELRGQASFPLSLMDWRISSPSGDRFRWLIALDQDGQVVWYYVIPQKVPTASNALIAARLQSGNWMFMTREFGFEEFTPDARLVRRIPLARLNTSPHHDFLEVADGRLLFLGGEEQDVPDPASPSGKSRVRGDTLHLLDLASGSAEQIWSAFDALNPAERPEHWRNQIDEGKDDWTHGNTITMGPRGNYILSFRQLDQIISLSPDLATIEWKLGGPSSSFSFPDPTDQFFGQHAVRELPGNRILMFDNGNFRPDGEYSRGLEIELDYNTMTARKVWEYRHQPDIYSSKISSVERLPNGNTLVNFGIRSDDPTAPAVLVEARPDGGLAWQQSLKAPGVPASRYRAYPLDSLAGELAVEASAARIPVSAGLKPSNSREGSTR